MKARRGLSEVDLRLWERRKKDEELGDEVLSSLVRSSDPAPSKDSAPCL